MQKQKRFECLLFFLKCWCVLYLISFMCKSPNAWYENILPTFGFCVLIHVIGFFYGIVEMKVEDLRNDD